MGPEPAKPNNRVRVCMDRDADYRAKAEEAQRRADRSTSEVERGVWLRLAEGYLSLLRKRSRRDDNLDEK